MSWCDKLLMHCWLLLFLLEVSQEKFMMNDLHLSFWHLKLYMCSACLAICVILS